ncbi:MAG TPA: hypothetical protein VHV49_19205 [Pseudonocardiaceae bacterium]|nr:hypothetical protein [Pseudonocardiaceae bacterium]
MPRPDVSDAPVAPRPHALASLPSRPAPTWRADRANPPSRPGPVGTLVAAGVVQAGQAFTWVLVGLLIGLGDKGLRHGQPVTVVLAIAAILAFAIGCFALALAAGTIRGSDVCRIASVLFQLASAGLIIGVGTSVVRQVPEQVAGAAFVMLLVSCVATAMLLLWPRMSVVD